ncbi:MAG TPA: tetratricopeptide repeat protein [Pyrinomonadaceae bacterium]|jgi:tetratricopeptide (TPR) repeat protein
MLFRFRHLARLLLALSLTLSCATLISAQTDDGFGDAAVDPVKLFDKGQDAHQKGDLALALEFYEEAIKVRPDFPEAEYQRAAALVSLGRLPEAEKSFRRAVELRAEWALPQAALGALLARLNRPDEAQVALERALTLDARNVVALLALTDLYLRRKAPAASLRQLLGRLQQATASDDVPGSLWSARGSVERLVGDKRAALISFDRALTLNPNDASARTERAELRAEAGDFERALEDANALLRAAPRSVNASVLLARIQAQAGKKEEAQRTLAALDESAKQLPEVVALRNALLASDANDPESCAALQKLLETDQRNASLLAHLGSCYRVSDPARSMEYYRRASDLEPRSLDYATGYTAALVQARRFAEAVTIARRILSVAPDNYTAHANLATALYELKRFPEAMVEFNWLLAARPDLTVAYFFIGTAHDYLGEFPEALTAYEKFLAHANPQDNQLEIEKINLRLPSLRRQIANGEGAKRKKKKNGQ